MFHETELCPIKNLDWEGTPVTATPIPEVIAGDEEPPKTIEEIVGMEWRDRSMGYIVKYEGLDSTENEWLPSHKLRDEKDKIRDFHKKKNPERVRAIPMKGHFLWVPWDDDDPFVYTNFLERTCMDSPAAIQSLCDQGRLSGRQS